MMPNETVARLPSFTGGGLHPRTIAVRLCHRVGLADVGQPLCDEDEDAAAEPACDEGEPRVHQQTAVGRKAVTMFDNGLINIGDCGPLPNRSVVFSDGEWAWCRLCRFGSERRLSMSRKGTTSFAVGKARSGRCLSPWLRRWSRGSIARLTNGTLAKERLSPSGCARAIKPRSFLDSQEAGQNRPAKSGRHGPSVLA